MAYDDVPEAGAHFDIAASAAERSEIARLAGVREIPKFEASFDVNRHGDGLRVTGHVVARVGQSCVVTLEPIENEMDEAVDTVFSPTAALDGKDVSVLQGQEPPELLVNATVDLAALATEFLLLGIDPYPRKPGVKFAPAAAGDPPDPSEHPFAALAALKKQP